MDDYHGTRVADPYRWLEDTASPATQQFVAAENALTRPWLDALPRLPAIRARLDQLYRYERFGVPVREGGRYFYLHNDGKQDQAVLMVSANAAESRVRTGPGIDQSQWPARRCDRLAGGLRAVAGWPLAGLCACRMQDRTGRPGMCMDVDNRQGPAGRACATPSSRARPGRGTDPGFYYSAYPGGDDKLQAVVRWHRVGEPQSPDREVFAVRDHSTRVPYGEVSEDGRYLVITLDEGTLSNGIMVMALDGGAAEPVFVQYDGDLYLPGVANGVGTELLFRTTAGAPNGRVVAVDLGKTGAQRNSRGRAGIHQCAGIRGAGGRQGHRRLPARMRTPQCSCSMPPAVARWAR